MERLVTVQFHKSLWCPDSMLALGAAVGTAAVPCPRGPQARPGDPRATTVHVPQLSAPEEPWPLAWDPSTLQPLLGARVGRAVGWSPSASVASSLQPPKDDAAIVGAVRLFSVLIAALTMDLAGRKVLLFISGEHRPAPPSAVGRAPAEQWALWLGALGWGCGAVMPALGACPPPRRPAQGLAHTSRSRKGRRAHSVAAAHAQVGGACRPTGGVWSWVRRPG